MTRELEEGQAVLAVWPSGATAVQASASDLYGEVADKYPSIIFMEIEDEV